MQAFATTPIAFKEIVKQSFRNWLSSLKLVWPLILILVLIRQYAYFNCSLLQFHSSLLQNLNTFLVVLVDITLWVGISVAVYRSFQLQATSCWQLIVPMFKRSLWLLLTLFIYSIFVSLAGFIGYNLGFVLIKHVAVDSPLLQVVPLLIGLPMIYILVLMLFTMPMLIIDELSVWQAFKHSAAITGPHWFRAFFAYIGIVLFLVILREIYLLELRYSMPSIVNIGIDILSFLALVPLFVNFYVLILHDLKLRAA